MAPIKNTLDARTGTQWLERCISVVLMLLGLMVMAGWLLHVPAMVQIKTGLLPMVFNTSLCFFVTGLAIALMPHHHRLACRLRNGIGFGLITLCGLTLVEIVLDRSLGIDLAVLHAWYDYGNTRPGRMAPNTALGFILVGSILLLTNGVQSKSRALWVVGLTFFLLTVGLTGLVGYVLGQDVLFGWAKSARMALHTATGMILTAIGLWLVWSKSEWYASRQYFREAEKIRFLGSMILVTVTVTVGLIGFVVLQSTLEKTLGSALETVVRIRTPWFAATVHHAAKHAESSARLSGLVVHSKDLLNGSRTRATEARVSAIAVGLLQEGFRGIAVVDAQGRVQHVYGQLNLAPEIVVAVDATDQSFLVWDGETLVRSRIPLGSKNQGVGQLVVDQAVPELNKAMFNAANLGNTGEIAACTPKGDALVCFPGNLHDRPFSVTPRAASGKPLPMEVALAGKTGLVNALDYRGKAVTAAFGPLSPTLGYVAKQETADMYAVIREALAFGAPIILLAALLGAALLYSQLHPLATQMHSAELAAAEKEQELRAIMEAAGDGILTMDRKGAIQSANKSAGAIFGRAANELTSNNIRQFIPTEWGSRQPLSDSLADYVSRPNFEMCGLHSNGMTFPLEFTINEVSLLQKRHFVGVVSDISQRKDEELALTRLAKHDSLTSLPNRFLFMDRLQSAALRSRRSGTAMVLFFLDLDGFKQVNDRLGHQAGDELLIQFAQRLTSLVRKTDTVARLAGDEFTIILEELTHADEDADNLANKILTAVARPFLLSGGEATVTASIGIVVHQAQGSQVEISELLERADSAMYAAKHAGKNAFRLG